MSMSDVTAKLSALPDFHALAGASEEQIAQAEQALSLRFAEDYRQYVRAFGVASAAGHELTGICASKRLNVVEVTLAQRSIFPALPSHWYVLEEANIDGIVLWQNAAGEVYQAQPGVLPEKLAGSICEYLDLCQ